MFHTIPSLLSLIGYSINYNVTDQGQIRVPL